MEFKEWLIQEKQYSPKASMDVQSRLRRALSFSHEPEISTETIGKMESNIEFKDLSACVKSQLRRGVRLFIEFNECN